MCLKKRKNISIAQRLENIKPMISAGASNKLVAMRRMPSLSIPLDPRRNATQNFEVSVQSPLHHAIAIVRFSPRGLHDLRQRCDQRTIDRRDRLLDIFKPFVLRERLELLTQFGDGFFEPICLEDRRRCRKRSQRGSSTTQLFLNLLQFACLLNSPQ